jgi:hypothetical protein
MKEPNEAERATRRAAREAAREMADDANAIFQAAAFLFRGLSPRTVKLLRAASVDLPERLLFMTEEQIKAVSGLDKKSRAEIEGYRAKFPR